MRCRAAHDEPGQLALQLTNVSRPRRLLQGLEGPNGESSNRLLVFGGGAFEEIVGERGDVFAAVAERGHMDFAPGDPVKEILAEVEDERGALPMLAGSPGIAP